MLEMCIQAVGIYLDGKVGACGNRQVKEGRDDVQTYLGTSGWLEVR
jgi:hypothetical protein